MRNPFDTYLAKLAADFKRGKATEHTYRSSLENLLESLAPHIEASNDPKHVKCGAPDFIVERRYVPIGYVETKNIGDDLDKVEKSEQLKRYRESLNNLILTDYLEFRWYVNGARRLTARIATVGKDKKLVPDAGGIAQAQQLFEGFFQTDTPIVGAPKELAQRMAALTKIVCDLIIGALREEGESGKGVFHEQLEAFRSQLLPALKPEEFADIYAQTMAYGLFAARIEVPEGKTFDRAQAYIYLPRANPFLRYLFRDVGEELDGTVIAPFLDDLAELLRRADMAEILKNFGRRTRTEDPVVHFYETFLAAYDPKLRDSRGVYYTPEPAVAFIVNSVDALLRSVFRLPLGLADPSVNLLDPAVGTATFLYAVISAIYRTLRTRGQLGMWQEYVRDHLLTRIFGFELLMAPYAIAHLKLGLLLKELGYSFGKGERLGVFLTNTLEEAVTHAEILPGLNGYLSVEGNAASVVKKFKPIRVVLGNPPYSGHSANKGKWIGNLVREYYFVDGKPLGERNPKWLQDDYVKFIRYAQWRIQQTGQGIVGFITNHGYLDNPTFRGMRRNLLDTFDEIYVLDLHGNAKKKETAPDGGKDENVFDIQQGVAILLAVKHPPVGGAPVASQSAQVHHAHLYGLRKAKYEFLAGHDVTETEWTELRPTTPFYLFVPQDTDLQAEYERGWKVTDLLVVNSLGVTTARDEFAVTFERSTLEKRIADLKNKDKTDAQLLEQYDLHDTQSWRISESRVRLRSTYRQERVCPFDYRPFDTRWTYHDSAILERDRGEVMNHLHHKSNFALVTLRRTRGQDTWNFAFVGRHPTDKSFITSLDNAFVLPLYLYTTPQSTAGTLFEQSGVTREPNLAPTFVQAIGDKLGLTFVPDGAGDLRKTFGPEDVFHYIYAVFHSPTYRARYAEFLKIDFPRVPLTGDVKLFRKLATLGAELVDLHLLRASALDNFITSFPVSGSSAVEKVRHIPSPEHQERVGVGAVWINDKQYFGGVPDDMWNFKVGGYQVCDKWLKDRKGRVLSAGDIAHYQRIVVALKETIRLMKEIDKAIPKWPIE